MMSQQEHERLGRLLPWFANGTLDTEERRAVAGHLEHCEACREELAFLGDVRGVLRVTAARDDDAPTIRNAGFHSLLPDLQQRVVAARPVLPRKRYWMPALAAGFLAAVGLGVALSVAWLDAPRYRTASSDGAPAEGHVQVVVTFTPGASLRQLHAVLREHDALVVRAPQTDERWVLEVPARKAGDIPALLTHLRSHEGVSKAEPVATEGDVSE